MTTGGRYGPVLVVGAGIVGRSVAYYLARGGVRVVVADRDPEPSSTTRASLGVLTHPSGGSDPYSSFYRDSHALHEPLSLELLQETGLDVGWRRLGGVDLAFEADEATQLRSWIEVDHGRGADAEWLDEKQLRDAEPSVSMRACGGVRFGQDDRVDPVRLATALERAASSRGAVFRYGVTVARLEPEAGGVTCTLADDGGTARDFFDTVVIAAGSWSTQIAAEVGTRLKVRPVRGQSCRLHGATVRHVVRWAGYHVLPAEDLLLVGGTVEDSGFDTSPTADGRRELSAWCDRVLEPETVFVSQRVGLRPKPRQGRPLIGPLPGFERVLAATGHYKNGVLMGPLTGQVVARWIIDGNPGRDMSRFSPAAR